MQIKFVLVLILLYRRRRASEAAYVVAFVGNSSFGSVFKKLGGVADQSYPGKAATIQLISTTLHDNRGVDALR